jgi:hypothetical protein
MKGFSLEKNSPFHNHPEMHPLKLSDAKPVPLHIKYVVTRMYSKNIQNYNHHYGFGVGM